MIATDAGHIYDVVTKVLGTITLVGGAVGVVVVAVRWVRKRTNSAPPNHPIITLGAPSYAYSTVNINERTLTQTAYLTRLGVSFGIQNKEATVTVRDVVPGVRRRDGLAEYADPAFRAPALAPLESALVQTFDASDKIWDGLTEQDFQESVVIWAQFTDPHQNRWEVVYDPVSREHSYTVFPGGV